MRAMILAAGLGKRLRPLTDSKPKPLLQAGGKALIEYHLERLSKLGVQEVVINTHWCGDQLPLYLGDGDRWGLQLRFVHEQRLLETAGGILNARPWAEDEVFLLVNGDVYFEDDLQRLVARAERVDGQRCQALLAMTANPVEHPQGDFVPADDSAISLLQAVATPKRAGNTYAGVALLHARLFEHLACGVPAPLAPLLRAAMAKGALYGWYLPGFWLDVGTPERLATLRQRLEQRSA